MISFAVPRFWVFAAAIVLVVAGVCGLLLAPRWHARLSRALRRWPALAMILREPAMVWSSMLAAGAMVLLGLVAAAVAMTASFP